MLVALVSSDRRGLSWIPYVLMSVAGSMLGVFVIDLLMRKTGEKGLERFVTKNKIEKIRQKIENKTGLTIFLASVMPPPFPFTPVVMTASALQCSRGSLLGAVFLGRLVRFSVEALLAIYFGRKLLRYMNSAVMDYLVYAVIAIAMVGSVLSVGKWLRNRNGSVRNRER